MRRSKKQLNSALRRRRQRRLVVGTPESLERRQLLTASPFGSPEDVARLAGSQLPLVVVDESSLATNLVASSFGSATTLVVGAGDDVFSAVASRLGELGGAPAIHLVSHGSPGSFTIGGSRFAADTIDEIDDALLAWNRLAGPGADLYLWGCDIAAGDGASLIDSLHTVSGFDVAASIDATGPARLGGDFDLEYAVGDVASPGLVDGVDVLWDTTLAASLTASAGTTDHAVFGGPTVVDAGITATGVTAASITVVIGTGAATGDTLAVPATLAGVPAYTRSFDATSKTLAITVGSGSFTAANIESLFRAVTFAGAADRGSGDVGITFAAGAASAAKTVAVTLFTETQRTNLAAAFTTIEASIATPIAAQTTAGQGDSTEVPFTGRTVSDLFYPATGDTDKEGKAVVDLTLAIQPYKIGTLLALGSTATDTLDAADASPSDLVVSLSSELARLVGPAPFPSPFAAELNASTSSVTVTTDTIQSGGAITAVTFTLDVLATRGADTPLDLDTVADDLGITLLSPPTVTVGGGVRYKMTVSLDLATSVVTVSFDETKTGGFGGLSFEELTTDIAIGMIGGQFVDASGSAGVLLPLDFGGNASRTVADWASATVSSFGAATGTADFNLPITAGINGTTVTTANTQVVVADTDIFDDEPPLYTTTDFDTVRWFAGLTTERVIQQLLDVGGIYGSLTSSGSDLLGVTVPFVADTSLGDLFDFKSLFDAEIGSKIDIYQPILNTTGRDELLDWRLPISDDSTPVQSLYSDLRGGFAFGIVVNETWPVHTVGVEARDRNTLADLVSDINAALEALEGGSGIGITAEVVSSKLVFRATDIAVQSFAIVPVAVEAGRLAPADGEGKTVGELEPGWYTVIGTTTGAVTGTNFYGPDTPLGAAAVHAGLLANGQTGVVRVHGLTMGIALGSTRHGITSLPLLAPGSTFLVSSGEVELARLGITPLGEPLAVLETADTAGLTATLPLRATTGAASLRIGSGSGAGTVVTVAAQSNATVVQTLAAVNAALATAGVAANVQARLVTEAGVVISGDPTDTAYLQFFRPTGSAWSTLAIAPVSDGQANETVELGFLLGDIAARPRPAALRTFDDFTSDALFPDITITPVYTPPTDTSPGFVTMQFAASGSGTVNRAADISFKTTPLGAVTFADDSTVSLPTTYGLNFGVRFGIGPSSPAVLVAGLAPVATGRLTADATLSLDLVMQDRYTVVLPAEWTSTNSTVQDLVSDLNRALGQATNNGDESVDLVTTDRLVARYGQFSGRIELVTASRANDGAPVTIAAALTGDLAADLDVSFTYAGRTWTVTVPAADTAAADTLQSRIGQLNTALADATPASGVGESLYDRVFFTTRSTAAGGVEVLLASVDPPAEAWPATVRLTAARSNAAVTALGFSDGGSAATSEIVARASGVTAAVMQHSNGQPFATGTLDTTLPSLSGSTMLGFNAIAFGGSSGEIDAKVALSVPNPVATAVALSDLAGSFTRTLTKSDGTGTASAGITLENLSASSTIAAGATIAISVPDLTDITTIVDQPLGIPVPVPFQSIADDGFTLTSDATIVFIANSATYTVTVTAAQAVGNGSFADLVADFNASLAGSGGTGGATIRRLGDPAAAAAGNLADEFVVKAVGDRLQVFARVPAANPDYGVTQFLPTINAFGELGLQGSFGVATVADALAEALGVFDTLRFDVAALATTELPLLNQPLAELIRLDTGLARRIDALRTANVTGPAGLAPAISRALGITADMVSVAFDGDRSAYRIDVAYDTGTAISRNLNLDLEPFFARLGKQMPEGLGILSDGGGSSPLDIVLGGTSVLSVGIDLTDPTSPRTFLYGHDGSDDYDLDNGTSFEITLRVEGEDIAFTAGVGAFGLFIRGGTATIGGEVITVDGEEQVAGNAAVRITLTDGEPGSVFYVAPQASELDALDAANYAAAFSGVLDVSLPLFAPTEFIPLPNTPDPRVTLSISDLGGFVEASDSLVAAADAIASLVKTPSLGTVDGKDLAAWRAELDDARGAVADVLSVNVPDLSAAAEGDAPTLIDLLRDPALFLDGIDVYLGTIETALSGLSEIPLPIVSDALGTAARDVFGFRRGWLREMKAQMRGAGESIFEVTRDTIFDFLGPDGLGMLLEDNGDRTVAGMVEAASVDAVTLAFVDRSGDVLDGNVYGAHGVEFRMRLGQQLLDTGLDLDFSFDALAPLFELSLDGGLRFQLGWDISIGFGFNLDDGFYTIVDATANEAQLRFDAFLDTASRDYTVDYQSGAWVVVDGDGNVVNAPGTDSPMRALAVNRDGQDVTAGVPLPGATTGGDAEEDCGCGDRADEADDEPIWWVVAAEDEDSGDWVPATFDDWGRLVPVGDDDGFVDRMVEITAVAPATIRGDLFFLTLQATDKVRLGLRGVTAYDSLYTWGNPLIPLAPQVDADARDDATTGINRNNELPTLFSGSISVNVLDPSAASIFNRAEVADTISGYGLADRTGKLIYPPGSAKPTAVREFYEIHVLDVATAEGDDDGFIVGTPMVGVDPILIPLDALSGPLAEDLVVPVTIDGVAWLLTIPMGTTIADSKALVEELLDARLSAVIDADENGVVDPGEEPESTLVGEISFGFLADEDGAAENTDADWWIIQPPTGTRAPGAPVPTVDDWEPLRRMKDDPSRNRITFDELRFSGSSLMQVNLVARAVVNLELDLSIADSAAIPRILADLNLDWSTDARQPLPGGTPAPGSSTTTVGSGINPQLGSTELDLLPEVGLSNIKLDVGSFLTDVLKPIVSELDKAFKPLDPVLDALQTRIPVLSDIAGRKIELADLLATFGGPKGKAAATLIDAIIAVRELVGVVNDVPDGVSLQLPLGRFWLPKTEQAGRYAYGEMLYDNAALGIESGDFDSNPAENPANVAAAQRALGKLEAQNADNPAYKQPGVDSKKRGGFRVPILQDPVNVFKLLMGRDAVLVTYSLPEVDLSVGTSFPLIKIFVLEVGLRFQIDVKAQMHFGYDTYGVRMFLDSGDIEDVFHGFYISDRAKADGSGADVDELTVEATIALYGGVDVVLAKAGIEGGFTLTATVNLNDPNNDGKLRFTEIVELVSYTGNPLDIVDVTMRGEVYARYYYWVGLRIWTPWKKYTITLARGGKTFARMTLFTLVFEGSDGPPAYASKVTSIDRDGIRRPNTLLLHAGTNAPKRVSNQDPLKTKDGAERFKIWNSGSTVYVQYLNYSTNPSDTQVFTGIDRVLFDGGIGDDELDASGLDGLPIDFVGGTGDDTVLVGSGSETRLSILDGGAGNDRIEVAGGGRFRILGGLGDDEIESGTGTVSVNGGAGGDTITTGAGSTATMIFDRQYGADTLELSAAALVNLLDFTESSSGVAGLLSGAGSSVAAGVGNIVTFNLAAATELRGSQQRDRFTVTDPSTRQANGGRGLVLRGGLGDDIYEIIADTFSGVSVDGITIDDTLPPLAVATAGDVTLSDGDCGHICEIAVDDPGLGYTVAPDVVIVDETGSGARAVASLDDQGRVARIIVTREGRGYTNPQVFLVNPASYSDKLVFTSTAATATLDRGGNGEAGDYRIAAGGKDFKFVGWTDVGTIRPDEFDGSEIDSVTVNLPQGVLTLAEGIDLFDTFTVNAHRMEQNARIVADTVSLTTDNGFQVRYAIDAVNNGDVTIRSTGNNLANYATSWAQADTTVASSAITGVTLTNAGDHYWFAPSITFAGGGGSGARAQATVSDGQITGITVLGGGSGYYQSPRPQVVIAPAASIQIDAMITSTNPGSAVGYGDGRGRVLLYADKGSVVTAGEVFFPFDTRAGAPRGARTVDWLDGDFRYRSMVAFDDLVNPIAHPGISVGTGAEFTAILDDDGRVVGFTKVSGGSGYVFDLPPSVDIEGLATAVAIVADDGTIEGLRITYPGEGYGQAPRVTIQPNGFGRIVDFDVANPAVAADGTPLNRVHIQAAGGRLVTVAGIQIGDPSKPLKSDVETFVAQTIQAGGSISLLEKDGLRIGRDEAVDGIITSGGNVAITTFGGALELGAPVQRVDGQGRLLWQDDAKTIPIYERDANGDIVYEGGQIRVGDASVKLTADDIEVNVPLNSGLLASTGREIILQPVKVDAEIGLSGARARVEAVMADGGISSFTNVWGGRGYLTAPTVVVAPPGERAFGTATARAGAVQFVEVVFGGTNYTTAPVVTLIGGGIGGATPANPAVVEAVVGDDGSIIGFTVTSGGSGYVTAPRVDVALPGQQARVLAVLDTANPDPVSGRFAVSHFEVLQAGSNYTATPRIEVAAPYDFTLDADEIDQFNESFETVVIGRIEGKHLFHSPEGSFQDGLVLRAPRAGGTIDMNSLVSTGTVSIVGSGNTFHFDTAAAAVSGTAISIDDNVIVHADVSGSATATAGSIMIFGTGKGMIDGDPLGDDVADHEDLLLAAHTNVTVTGAIGSRWKLDDLTVTSATRGTVNLDQSVSLTGTLDITGGGVTIGGSIDVGGDLLIDASSMVSFAADVTVGGNLVVMGATGVTFAGSLTVGGTITLVDVPGTVRFGSLVKTVGVFSVTATTKIEFMGGLAASDDVVLTSNEVDFRGGVASITAPGGVPATATLLVRPSDPTRPIRVGTPMGTATNTLDISDTDLAAIAAGWKRVVIGDEVDGTGAVTVGSIGTQQGGRNSWLASTTTIVGGSVTVTQKVDVSATATFLELLALGDGAGGAGAGITIKAAINQTPGERNDWIRLTSAGAISLEAPIWAGETVSLTTSAGGTIRQTGSAAIGVRDLAIIADGAVTLTDSGNAFDVVAIKTMSTVPVALREDSGYSIGEITTTDAGRDSAVLVTVTGIDVGTQATATLTSSGIVTQTQPVTVGTLDLRGSGGRWTLTGSNVIGTLTANTGSLSVVDAAQMDVGVVTASQATGTAVALAAAGGLRLTDGITTGGGDAQFNDAVTLAGDVAIDVVDGMNTGTARFLATLDAASSGQRSLTIMGKLDARDSIGATQALEFLSVSGDATLAGGKTFRTAGDQTYAAAAMSSGTITVEAGSGKAVRLLGTTMLGGLSTAAGDYDVELLGTSVTVTNAVTFTTTGTVRLGDQATDDLHFVGGVTSTAPAVTRLGGKIRTTNADATFGRKAGGVVRLDANTTVSTGSGKATFSGTVDGPYRLVVAAAGDTTFSSAVGAGAALAHLETDAPGRTLLHGGTITTSRPWSQVYNDDVLLGATTVVTATNNGAVTFVKTLSGGHSLTVNTAGTTTFGGAVSIASLETDAGGTTRIGGNVTTSAPAGQVFNDAAILTADAALSAGAGAISFARSLDGGFNLSVNTTGTATFGGKVGDGTPLASLTTDALGTSIVTGGLVRTSGQQIWQDDVVLLGNDTDFRSVNAAIASGAATTFTSVGKTASLTAATGIGTAANPIRLAVTDVTAEITATGDIYLVGAGDLVIGTAGLRTPAGQISLGASSDIRVPSGGRIAAGSVAGKGVTATKPIRWSLLGTGDSGAGSLRQVIDNANTTGVAGVVVFSGAANTFVVASRLPAIASPLTIDGTGHGVVIDANRQVDAGVILQAAATGSVVRGLSLRAFTGFGITLDGVRNALVDRNTVTSINTETSMGLYATGDLAGTRVVANTFAGGLRGALLDRARNLAFGQIGQGNVLSGNRAAPTNRNFAGTGIRAQGDCAGTVVAGNVFTQNNYGFAFISARDLSLTGNSFTRNSIAGIYIEGDSRGSSQVASTFGRGAERNKKDIVRVTRSTFGPVAVSVAAGQAGTQAKKKSK